jgi:hypothetical protein
MLTLTLLDTHTSAGQCWTSEPALLALNSTVKSCTHVQILVAAGSCIRQKSEFADAVNQAGAAKKYIYTATIGNEDPLMTQNVQNVDWR